MITFSNVSLIYPNSTKTILEDLSFTIQEGELVLVIGSTGSGKSSLLRLINGLVPHHTGGILAGDISVDGNSTQLTKPGGLAHLIGIVGQNPLNGFVTDKVEDELVFGMEALNLPPELMRKRVEEILDLLGLVHLRNRSLATLSGGEQQRVAIGSALVMHPKVLVLDEPTSALDPIAAEEVLSILHRLVHDLSITVVIAEHKLERVIGFADRILYIQGDGSATIDSPEEIMRHCAIAPPIVHLARALGLSDVGLSVRDLRRMTTKVREELPEIVNETEKQGSLSISAKDVEIKYGERVALKGASCRIHQGEVIAVMGRNGAGKSTLLSLLVGLLQPTSGHIEVQGVSPHTFKASVRREKIGFIPQEPSDLLYHQSVEKECRQADRDNNVEAGSTYALLIRLVQTINPEAHPRDLSEGQRLALALSIVLSGDPEILVLDEPTRGLDYQSKAILINTLRNFAGELQRPVVIATHDVELVAELADRVIFLADGEIVADGTTLDVLLSSPAFAPQVSKVMSPKPWLSVSDVLSALAQAKVL